MRLLGFLIALFSCIPLYCEDSLLKGCDIVRLELARQKTAEPSDNNESINQTSPEEAAMAYLSLIRDDLAVPKSLIQKSPYNISPVREEFISNENNALKEIVSFKEGFWKGFSTKNDIIILKTVEEGNLAICIFAVNNSEQPLSYNGGVIPLMKKDNVWRVGPLLGSFDNMGLPFNKEQRNNASLLLNGARETLNETLFNVQNKRQKELCDQIERQIKLYRDKSHEELIPLVIQAFQKRDPVLLPSLILCASENKSLKSPEDNLASILWSLKLSNNLLSSVKNDRQILKAGDTESKNIMISLAADPSNIIIPASPEQDNEEQNTNKFSFTVFQLNKLADPNRTAPLYDGISCFTFDLLKATGTGSANTPRFLIPQVPRFEYIPNPGGNNTNNISPVIASFHQYYPPKTWNSAEDAAKDILKMGNEADMTGLMQSIDPELISPANPEIFVTALSFLRNIVLSIQMPVEHKSSSRVAMIYNPLSPPIPEAYLYYTPDKKEAYILADSPESARTLGISKIRFKLTTNRQGKWILKFFPGFLRLLHDDPKETFYSLISNNSRIKNAPTTNDNDPFLNACREHFFETMQKE